MKRYIALAAAAGMAVMIAGCASTGGGGGGGGGAEATGGQIPNTNPPAPGENQTASAQNIRDFNLQVKCPGIHLEKTKLKWPDDQIMSHENVTPDDIAACERWEASQPKGYVPPPPAGSAPAGQQAQSGESKPSGGAPAAPPTKTQ